MQAYKSLCELERRIFLLNSVRSALEWDQQCVMPEDGAGYRALQISAVSGLVHQVSVSQEYEATLMRAEDEVAAHSADDKRLVHVLKSRRQFERSAKLPQELAEELAMASSQGQSCWEKAKKNSDFKSFAPALKHHIDLLKKKAQYTRSPNGYFYDELLKDYEWGVDRVQLDRLFTELRDPLVALLSKIRTLKSAQDKNELFSLEAQKQLGMVLAQDLGFDPRKNILLASSHPFSSTLGLGDYRITTRYSAHDPLYSFTAIAHEMGHSLYEQGLPVEDFGTSIGQAASFGIHESQSLFWEQRIVASPEFLAHWYPRFKESFPHSQLCADPESFAHGPLQVQPGYIRVEADEVTYCLHIMIRYEIEKALLDEGLDVEQVPELWNQKYEQYLGLRPRNDAEGCLQDVHWAVGSFGYFPSYALGHLYSAQFAHTFEVKHGKLSDFVKSYDLGRIRQWLGKHIHSQGSIYDPLDLVSKVSGQQLSSSYFLKYLSAKYQR